MINSKSSEEKIVRILGTASVEFGVGIACALKRSCVHTTSVLSVIADRFEEIPEILVSLVGARLITKKKTNNGLFYIKLRAYVNIFWYYFFFSNRGHKITYNLRGKLLEHYARLNCHL